MANKLKERIRLYTRFIKEGKVPPTGLYKRDLERTKKLLADIETGKLTSNKFNKLSTHDKWDIYWSKLIKNITWRCINCAAEQAVDSSFMGEICCSNCDAQLTYRTNGGQNNPFNWTFKKKK